MVNFIISIILELISIIVLSYKVFLKNNYNISITLLIIFILFVLIELIVKSRNVKNRKKDVYLWVLIGCIFVQILIYVLSIKDGYSNNKIFILNNKYLDFIETLIIIIFTEKIRSKVVNIDIRNRFLNAICYIVLVILTLIIDINISTTMLPVLKYKSVFKYIATIVVGSLSKNIFLCFLSKNYDSNSTILYRIIMDLSIYLIPVIDNTNDFIKCVLLFIFPFILYLIIDEYLDKDFKEEEKLRLKKDKPFIKKLIDFVVSVFIVIVVILVSRETTYCMIGVGSESMSGSVNKGDALVYKKYDKSYSEYEDKRLKVGDIIVFKRSNVLILHRINKIISSDGVDKYITKGDFNDNVDNWVVTQDDIEGVALFKVPYVAWPSVYLSELFK